MRQPAHASRLQWSLGAVLLSVLLPHAALAQSAGIPGFGGATEKPRMLVIFDTSKSMRFTPSENAEYPNMDYDPPGVGATSRVCQHVNQGNDLTITCPGGQTISQVEYAYYGRENENDLACDMGTTRPTDYTSGCDLGNSVMQEGVYRGWRDFNAYANLKCLGKSTCTVHVDNNTLADPAQTLNPCYGTSKYGVVSVICGDDPCPPGSGSKFCLGKRALYNVVDSADTLVEFAVAGYFQQYWEKANPEIPAGYQTRCKYDVIANGGLWWNNGNPGTTSNSYWSDIVNVSGGDPSTSTPPANTNYTFTCNPESMTTSTNLSGGTMPVALNGTCNPGQGAKTCLMRWSWQNNINVSGTGTNLWSGYYYQHPDPACRTIKPLEPTNSAAYTGACAPSLGDPETQFQDVQTSGGDTRNILATPYFGGDCSTAPASYTDIVNATGQRLPNNQASGNCTAAHPCTYFRNPAGDGLSATATYTAYQNLGPVPITVGTTTYTGGPATATQTTTNLAISNVGGGTSCPATATITSGWSGCSATTPCNVSGGTTNTNYSCPGDMTLVSGNQCRSDLARHSDALSGNSSNGTAYALQAGTAWTTYSYMIDLTAYVNAGNHCPDESANFTITGNTYQGVGSLPCGSSTTVTNGSTQCQAKFHPYSGTENAEKRTDLGKAICRFDIKNVSYRAQSAATASYTCNYTRTRYVYTHYEPTCQYRMYRWRFQHRYYQYNFQLAAGDYQGSFNTNTLVYPTTATTPYCSSTPSVEPHSDATGFSVPSGDTCAAELAPGTGGCPSSASRCKLRWGSAGNSRFENYVASLQLQPFTSGGPTPGCPVGDPSANDGAAPNRVGGYQAIHPDWCSTTSGGPYVAPTWNPPVLMGDYYAPGTSNAAGSRGTWLDMYTDALGNPNPFNHSAKTFDKFYWMTEPDVSGVQTPVMGPLANKTQGLSIFAPGSGVSAPSWEYGVTAYRWGDNMADPRRLLRRYDPVSNPVGLRMPDIGDMTPLAGALTNAHDYINWVRTHETAVGGDDLASCRNYSVLLITDGIEEPLPAVTGTDPVGTVAAMKADNISVYVIGFGNVAGASLLNQMAQAAGTDVSGSAYDATDYVTLISALNDVVGQQLNGYYTRSKPTITSDGKRLYAGYFANSGTSPAEFFGYLDAYAIQNGTLASSPTWRFSDKLNAMPAQSRNVFARPWGKSQAYPLKRFDDCNNPNDAFVEDITNNWWCDSGERNQANQGVFWMRNDYTGAETGTFTDGSVKKSRLTSIVHSQPAAVGAPNFSDTWATQNLGSGTEGSNFSSVDFYNAYRAFKNQTAYQKASGNTFNLKNREMRVFVQSNTGLVHAIREDVNQVDPLTVASWVGEESWAFAPRRIVRRLLSLRDGGKFGLDGALGISDVCFGEADCENSSGKGWRTMLVGAAGRGGNHLYALDITDPIKPVWLWDFNPKSSSDLNMGDTESGPVIARVRVKSDSYNWGVFLGGGYSSTGVNDCGYDKWNNWDADTRPIGQFFYILDADPADRDGDFHAGLLSDKEDTSHEHYAKWCIEGKNKVTYWSAMDSTWKDAQPKNNVPMRPRVVRPSDGSRALTVYFGDTDGKMMRMNMKKEKTNDWAPKEWFNPFHVEAECRIDIKPLPDHPGADLSLELGKPLQSEGLPELWTRPVLAVNDIGTGANGRTMVYVGSGSSRVPEKLNVQNYFWAIQENTGVSGTKCDGEAKWAYYLDKASGEKVISEPAIVGENILVAVYVPPGGSGGCGQAGYSKIYCFNRINGDPKYCLTDSTGSPIDPTAQNVAGQVQSRFVYAGAGILSDLVPVGNNSVVALPGVGEAGSDRIAPKVFGVNSTDTPFRVRSWRRVR